MAKSAAQEERKKEEPMGKVGKKGKSKAATSIGGPLPPLPDHRKNNFPAYRTFSLP
jgi:hypothetical protein